MSTNVQYSQLPRRGSPPSTPIPWMDSTSLELTTTMTLESLSTPTSHGNPTSPSTPLGLIKRILHAAALQVKKSAYETLVRPIQEYATCAWWTYTKVDTQTIERIQQAAARFASGDYQHHSSITAMLLSGVRWRPMPPCFLRSSMAMWTFRCHPPTWWQTTGPDMLTPPQAPGICIRSLNSRYYLCSRYLPTFSINRHAKVQIFM